MDETLHPHRIMKLHGLAAILIALHPFANAQSKETPPMPAADAAWQAKIAALAPASPRVKPAKPRKVLVCSLATGYCHEVIPHVKVVMDDQN